MLTLLVPIEKIGIQMTNLERLLEQSKDKNEIKDQIISVMFEVLKEVSLPPHKDSNVYSLLDTLNCRAKDAIEKIEQLAAQALGEK